jgi:hypothetical protein
MVPENETQMTVESMFCPECGAEESGYFCRNCGTLLRGQEYLLCPRCHQVVPNADFCNYCGQGLSGMALSLQQLALAGEDFWVTGGAGPATPAAVQSSKTSLWEPDESMELAAGDLPDWLQELPTETAPAEVQAHIYPALRPMEAQRGTIQQGGFLIWIVLFMGLMLLGLVAITILLLVQGG